MQHTKSAAEIILAASVLVGLGAHATPIGQPLDDAHPPRETFSCGTETQRWAFRSPGDPIQPQLVDIMQLLHHVGYDELLSATITPAYRPCGNALCGDIVGWEQNRLPQNNAPDEPTTPISHEFTGGMEGTYAAGITVSALRPGVYYGITPDGGPAGLGTVFRFTGYYTGQEPFVTIFSLASGTDERPTSIATDGRGRLYVTGRHSTIRLLEPNIGAGISWHVDPTFSAFAEPPPAPDTQPYPNIVTSNGMRVIIGSRLHDLANPTPPPVPNAIHIGPPAYQPYQDTPRASDVFGCHDRVVLYDLIKP